MASVIAATATPRFPPSHPSTRNMSGQVAATIITAQMSDDRNGLMIQKVAAIRSPIQRTCSVARVKSGGESLCIVISLPRFSFGGKSFFAWYHHRDCPASSNRDLLAMRTSSQ